MEIILYEDETVSELFPITLARPAYDIRTGGSTLLEAVKFVFPKAAIFAETRKHVQDISLVPQFSASEKRSGALLFLNARLAPDIRALREVAAVLKDEGAFVVNEKKEGKKTIELSWKMFEHPEEIIFWNRDMLKGNLLAIGKKNKLYLGKGVDLPKQFSSDTTHGPIVIGDHVTIRPFAVLRGPLIIGESSIVNEFSVIENSTIGPVCKVGGEISGTVIDGYSNKQHVGGLSNSYVGRWVNIGGGTFVSDLKITYSHVTVGGRDSGAQFLGTIIGDFSKTAVNTVIFPGKVMGAAAHLYGMVVEDVPSFTSHVRPGVLYELPVGLAEKGQKAMAMRRGVQFTEQDTARMVHIFDKTESERTAKNVKKGKISFN